MGLTTATFRTPELPVRPLALESPHNVIALLRVSTDAQDLARQHADLKRLERKYNLNYTRTVELHGISGTTVLNNAQIQQVLREITDPAIEGIACSALDRLFRPGLTADGTQDFTNTMAILQGFAKHHKAIFTAYDGTLEPWTDSGWATCMQLATAAGIEWRRLRQRSKDGKVENAQNGFRNSGSTPYGYRHVYRDKRTGEHASIAIDEPAAANVRQMFQWALAGLGVYEIAKRLNLANIPSPGAGKIAKRTKKLSSGRWDQWVVWKMLTNEIYRGHYSYPKGSPDAVQVPSPVIVEEPVWQAVQLQMAANKASRAGRTSRKYLLAGMLWCLDCGHRVCSASSAGYGRHSRGTYRCSHIDKRPPQRRLCDAPAIGFERLDTAISEAVWSTITQPDTLYAMLESSMANTAPIAAPKLAELEREITRLAAVEETAYVNLRDPGLAEIRQRTMTDWQDARRAKRAAEMELQALQQAAPEVPAPEAIRALARDLAATRPATHEQWRMFLQPIIREIRLNTRDAEAHIELTIPIGGDGGEKANAKSNLRVHTDQTFGSPFIRPLTLPLSFSFNVKL